MKETKRISRFNNKVDIASFEKISKNQYVFIKKNFWGFEDLSERYLLNTKERGKIWKLYCWFWWVSILILVFFIPNRDDGGLFCYINQVACDSYYSDIAFIFIPIIILFYRIFAMYQYRKIKSLYPLYTGSTTVYNSNLYNSFRLTFILIICGAGFYLGVQSLIKLINN